MSQETRDKVLAVAFTRALRDSYAPARKSAIQAFVHTQNYFSLRETATKVIPAISWMTIDPEPEVILLFFVLISLLYCIFSQEALISSFCI
jgi:SCY1-like protein 1